MDFHGEGFLFPGTPLCFRPGASPSPVTPLLRLGLHDIDKMTPRLLLLERPVLFVFACLFALTCAVGADTSRDEQIAERFASADTNHDGQLTLAEAEADMPRIAANFSKIDADKSGAVTLPEIEAKADR